MVRIKRFEHSGFILPLVVMVCGLLFAAIGAILFSMTVQTKNKLNAHAHFESELNNELGPQKGLVILSKRLSYLPNRIANGVANAQGEPRVITEADMANYAENSPAAFWMDWLNDIREGDAAVADQPNFVMIDNNTVSYTVDTPDNLITIKLISAFSLGVPMQDANSSGYNNTTFRYGYEITAQQKVTVAGVTTLQKSIVIASIMKADAVDKLVQVHLVRELSRFNLFAVHDTMQDGTILYDRTSYSGPVYLGDTRYVGGTPLYSDTIQISRLANPSYSHQTSGTSFVFHKPGGAVNTPALINPIDMPNTSSQESLKTLAHKMNIGQNPNATTVAGIYVGTTTVNSVSMVTTVFVNGTDSVDTQIKISNPNNVTNRYTITHGTDLRVVDQDVMALPAFLIFVQGRLLIEGVMAENTKLTVNGSNDIIITNDLKYMSGGVGPNTILGLVSWDGNILVARNIPPPNGQTIKNLTIHGVLMTVNGAFGAQGYDDFPANYPAGYVGTIYHVGAFIRKWNLPTLSNDGTKGWGLQTNYDTYLAQSKAPPYFPGNGGYKLIDQNLCAVVEVYSIKR